MGGVRKSGLSDANRRWLDPRRDIRETDSSGGFARRILRSVRAVAPRKGTDLIAGNVGNERVFRAAQRCSFFRPERSVAAADLRTESSGARYGDGDERRLEPRR